MKLEMFKVLLVGDRFELQQERSRLNEIGIVIGRYTDHVHFADISSTPSGGSWVDYVIEGGYPAVVVDVGDDRDIDTAARLRELRQKNPTVIVAVAATPPKWYQNQTFEIGDLLTSHDDTPQVVNMLFLGNFGHREADELGRLLEYTAGTLRQ